MVYDHMVKVNGIYYATGEDVPDEIEEKKAVRETSLPFSDNDITFEEQSEYQPDEKQYTKTEINSMKTAELQELAAEVGIEDAYETSGVELKRRLAEYFNL